MSYRVLNWKPGYAEGTSFVRDRRARPGEGADKQKKTEVERDRALHHLQLAEASLRAERNRAARREVVRLRLGTGGS